MRPVTIRMQALQMRQAGYSYGFISERTGLTKSTLSDWLSGIPYTPNTEVIERIGKARAASGAKKSFIRQQNVLKAIQEARRELGTFSKRDMRLFGLGLYLGEGTKSQDCVRIVNSDPRVILLAMAWFCSLGLEKRQFVMTLHLYPDSDVKQCLRFWSRTTGVPRSQFLKTQIDMRTNKKSFKTGKLPYGTAHLGIRALGNKNHGTYLFHKIMGSINVIVEKSAGLV